jgi:CRP-like cAMP-binding protein
VESLDAAQDVGGHVLVPPGVGRPAAEWRRAIASLRSAVPQPAGTSRTATLADVDLLVGRVATFGQLTRPQRESLIRGALVREVPEGTRLVSRGEAASSASFILDGEAVAVVADADGGYRALSTMGVGDFFGEIAALTGSPRTADVVADTDLTVMEVPAEAPRTVMTVPEIRKLVLSTLTSRLLKTEATDLPRLAGIDQESLRDLRTPRRIVVASAGTTAGDAS